MDAIDRKFESAAINFAGAWNLRHRLPEQDVHDLVDFLIWEAMPFHIERRDPEQEAWDYASDKAAQLLSDLREELVSRFRP
jgi:hypothetical protein